MAEVPKTDTTTRPPDAQHESRFALAALERHKQEGLELATRARLIALGVVAIMLPFLNQSWNLLYYEFFLLVFALNGLAQRHVGRVGRSASEFGLMAFDLVLLTFVFAYPPPFTEDAWPTAMGLRFGNFVYFFIILGAGTLMYNWRTLRAMGHWTVACWLTGMALIWAFGKTLPEMSEAAALAFGADSQVFDILDPNSLELEARVQEVVVFVLVAYTLALSGRRYEQLLLGNAALERERANLSRYFSPNVVEELSQNDTPLREVREQDVAVLFVDLVGFTSYAAERPGRDVIETLRAFHGRMEACVFAHGGTLDKYLGDGLMATFGTPITGPDDAHRALACGHAMLAAVERLNHERKTEGLDLLKVSVGVHFGPVVLGDIGANRLEFAVIGNTVNVASRVEGLSRDLGVRLVVSDALYEKVGSDARRLGAMSPKADQSIRGLDTRVRVWVSA